jgi:hypothetical protein
MATAFGNPKQLKNHSVESQKEKSREQLPALFRILNGKPPPFILPEDTTKFWQPHWQPHR